jgi:hypothetical protein
MFSDLRGFTPIGEHYGDDVAGLGKYMNGYMDSISQSYHGQQGHGYQVCGRCEHAHTRCSY